MDFSAKQIGGKFCLVLFAQFGLHGGIVIVDLSISQSLPQEAHCLRTHPGNASDVFSLFLQQHALKTNNVNLVVGGGQVGAS